MKKIYILIFLLSLVRTEVYGQISIPSSTPVTENFAIGATATASLPANWKMSAAGAGSSSLTYTDGTNVTATLQQASSGAPTTGSRYNWGDGTTTTDRAIGFMTSGGYASPNSIMAFYRNTSGTQINDITITFDIERYRINTAAASVTFFTSTNGTAWTSRTAGDIATGVFATGASSYAFTGTVVSKSVTLTGVNIADTGDFYVMWLINTTGASSQGLGLDNVSLTATLAPSNTSTVAAGASTEPTTISSLVNTQGASSLNFDFDVKDDGATPATDATNTQISQIVFNQGTGNTVTTWTDAILGAELSDGTNTTTTATINATNITFAALPNGVGQIGNIVDNGTKNYTLKIWLKTSTSIPTTIDNLRFVFLLTNTSFTFASGGLIAAQSVNSGSTNNAITVTATKLAFVTQTSNTNMNANMTSPTVQATDANGNRDLDYTTTISITSTGTLNSTPKNATPTSGLATFATINHTVAGTGLTLTATSGSLTSIISNAFNIIFASNTTDFFRSAVTSGTWNTAGSWESSSDNATWFTATISPTSAANTITIRNGHTIDITATVTADQVTINNGGILSHSGGTFTIANGTSDDLIIESGGTFFLNFTTTPTISASATIRVQTNGILKVGTNGGGTGDNFANDNSSGKVIYETGGIFEWNTSLALNTTNTTFFPDATASVIPIFRVSVAMATIGAGTPTTINGLLEVNADMTWANPGIKTFRNGIIGTGTLTQNSATTPFNQFQITGTNAKLGGTGTIVLNSSSGGLLITSTADVTLISDKIINEAAATDPNFTVDGILDCGAFNLIRTAGTPNFTLSSGATLKMGSANGITTSPTLSGNIQLTGTRTFSGAANYEYKGIVGQVTGNGLPASLSALLTINNSSTGVALSQNTLTTGQLILTTGVFDISNRGFTFHTNDTPITRTSGTITTNSSSDLTFGTGGNTGGNTFTLPNNVFTSLPTLNNFSINRANDLKLGNQAMTVGGILTVAGTNGDLDLNGNDITLTGTLSESRLTNAVVKDATATTEANKGGKIICTGIVITAAMLDAKGIGLALQRTGGANYTINIDRYHYSALGRGSKRLYDINLVAGSFSTTTTQIFYASQELINLPNEPDLTVGSLYINHFRTSTWINDITAQTNNAGTQYVEGTNSSGYSLQTLSQIPKPLPVTFLDFLGMRKDDKTILLKWATVAEIDNKGFDIEMSHDGFNFVKVGFQNGNNNKTGSTEYTFNYNCPKNAYFRLKQVDFSGNFSHSKVIFIRGHDADLLVYPNPITNDEQINLSILGINIATEKVKFVVTDTSGKIIFETSNMFDKAEKELQILFANQISSGTYLLSVHTHEKSHYVKIVKN